MQKPYDLMAKGLLEGALRGPCEVRVEEQVVADARAIDTVVVPDPSRVAELISRGLLGRIAMHTCVIEAFHDPPGVTEVDDCLLKTIALHARQRAAWHGSGASGEGEPCPLRARLWIISAGDPEATRAAWAMVPMPGWLTGCYWTGSELGPHLIVLRALPRTRDTLLLRLLGADGTLRAAYDDLRALPDDAWERGVLAPLLILLRHEMPRMGIGEYSPEEDTMRYQEAVEIMEQENAQIRAEGVREGMREGIAPLLRLYHRKLGRGLSAAEQQTLLTRLGTVGAERLGDLVLDLDGPALDHWLHDPLAG